MSAPRVWGALSARRGGFARVTSIERARAIVDTYGGSFAPRFPRTRISSTRIRTSETTSTACRAGTRGSRDSSSATGSRARSSSAWTSRIATRLLRSQRPDAGARSAIERAPLPFARLDLTASPLEEARRALDAGARGDQAPSARAGVRARRRAPRPIFELACERGVPVLIHGGRGLPPSRRTSRPSSDETTASS